MEGEQGVRARECERGGRARSASVEKMGIVNTERDPKEIYIPVASQPLGRVHSTACCS